MCVCVRECVSVDEMIYIRCRETYAWRSVDQCYLSRGECKPDSILLGFVECWVEPLDVAQFRVGGQVCRHR